MGHAGHEPDPARAERDARIVEMRKAGIGYRDIAASLGISEPAANAGFRRGLAAIPRESAEEMRVLSQGRQEFVTREMIRVMTGFHPLVNQGKVIHDPDTGAILDDPMPKIAAAKILMTVDERYARLFGLDAPRTSVTIAMDAVEAEIRKLEAELGENLPRGEGGVPGREPEPPRAIEGPQGFR